MYRRRDSNSQNPVSKTGTYACSVTSAIGGDRRIRTFTRLVRSQVIFHLIYISMHQGKKRKAHIGALTTELSFGVSLSKEWDSNPRPPDP